MSGRRRTCRPAPYLVPSFSLFVPRLGRTKGRTYALDLDPEKRLAAGTYFVRVHHAGRAVTEKATFLR